MKDNKGLSFVDGLAISALVLIWIIVGIFWKTSVKIQPIDLPPEPTEMQQAVMKCSAHANSSNKVTMTIRNSNVDCLVEF